MKQILSRIGPLDGAGVSHPAVPTFSYIYRQLPQPLFNNAADCKAQYPAIKFYKKGAFGDYKNGDDLAIAKEDFYWDQVEGKIKVKQGPIYYLEELDGSRASVTKAEAVPAASHDIVNQWEAKRTRRTNNVE